VTRDTAAERRSAPRVDARLPLQLTEPDTRLVVTTESLDLSRNGLACRTGEYLAPLSKVAVTVILPPFGNLSRASRSLRAEGVVVRCEQTPQPDGEAADREYDLACCFTALEPDARNLLDAFVAWRLLRSVRSEEPRMSSSHGSSGHAAHGRGAPRGRFGQRPRQGGRPSGPRQGRGDFRGTRGGGSGSGGGREGGRHERGQGYGPRRSGEGGYDRPRGERGDRRDRGRPSRHPRQGRGETGYVGSDRPRVERPYEERSQGGERRGDRRERGHSGSRETRGHDARGHESRGHDSPRHESGRGERPARGRFRGEKGRGDRRPRGRSRPGGSHERSSAERGRREGPHPAGEREFRPRTTHSEGHERPERETTERGEGSAREEKRGTWGRRPARRTSTHPRRDDSETRRR
jgi:hypothetical protein